MTNIKFLFPFKFDTQERISYIKTEIERKLAIISFGIHYNLNLTIESAILIKKTCYNNIYIYVFEFESLDCALEFMEDPIINVNFNIRSLDHVKLKDEIENSLSRFEYNRKVKRSKIDY